MGRLIEGATMLLFVLVTNTLLAFITTGATATATPSGPDCGLTGCDCGFLCDINFGALPSDTEPIIAALYDLIMGFLIVLGVTLVILSFLPTFSD